MMKGYLSFIFVVAGKTTKARMQHKLTGVCTYGI